MLAAHVWHIWKAHDTVIQFYYQQIHKSSRAYAKSFKNLGGQVHLKTFCIHSNPGSSDENKRSWAETKL